MKKRLLSLLLALGLVVGLLPVSALADGDTDMTNISTGEADGSSPIFQNIKIHAGSSSADISSIQNVSGFNFDHNVLDYYVIVPDTTTATALPYVYICSTKSSGLFYSVFVDGTTCTQRDKNFPTGASTLNPVTGTKIATLSSKGLEIGKTKTVSILARRSKPVDMSKYDERYNIHFTRKPCLQELSLQTVDGEDVLNPKYSKNGSEYVSTLYGNAVERNLQLTVKPYTATVACYLISENNNQETSLQNNESNAIDLNDYWNADHSSAEFSIKLVYNSGDIQTENTYKIHLSNNAPVITKQPESVTCNKDDSPSLSVIATASSNADPDSLTYQWYDRFGAIAGATSSTYYPVIDRSGSETYWCVVTNKVNGEDFSVKTDTVSVNVQFSKVSAPKIILQLGTFTYENDKDGAAGVVLGGFNTQYINGQKFNGLTIRTDCPETGVSYRYQLFHNTSPRMDGAKPFAAYTTTQSERFDSLTQRFTPEKGLSTGKHYIWCVITAMADDESLGFAPANTVSDYVELTYSAIDIPLQGSGTQSTPYVIESAEDFAVIREKVRNGIWLSGLYFQMTADITLPQDWEPIGCLTDRVQAFGGILNGKGHTLTIPKGGKPLLNYVSDAVIKNLNIYGEQIDGNGLIDKSFVDYGEDGKYSTGCPAAVSLENITLKKGSSTLRSGFMEGSGSGANIISISNCIVESGVTIGYSKEESGIGSFVGGAFNGGIENSYSYAAVYGVGNVGGLVAGKGQSMGPCNIRNSGFIGTIDATGDWVGGIIAKGYTDESAPNTPPVSFSNCYVSADITGNDYIGGLFGGEGGLKNAWNVATLCDNLFYGTITATGNGSHVGGIIGHYEGVNKNQQMSDNYFYEASGKITDTIGNVGNYVIHSSTYEHGFDNMEAANMWYANTGSAKTAEEFADGTVVALLNSSSTSMKNWVQGKDGYPVHDSKAVITHLEVSGALTKQHYIGDALDLTGLTLTAVWSDGRNETVALDDPELKITGYDSGKRAVQTVTLTYGAVKAEIQVTVLQRPTEGNKEFTVTFSLYGDSDHGDPGESTGTHTLRANNLDKWITNETYTVEVNDTVWDLMQDVAAKHSDKLSWSNPSGNYVDKVTWNGVTIGEFTNGQNSGWMYTLNGEHPLLGVSEQFLNGGDVIIFHYTDDYTVERGSEHWSAPEASAEKPKVTVQTGVDGKPVAKVELPKGAASAVATIPTAELGGGNVLVLVKPDGSEEIIKKSLVEGETAYALVTENCTVKLVDNSKSFNDTANHWAKDAIAFASSHELFQGTAANTFSPDMSMSRAMLAAVLYRLEDAAASGTNPFADVAAGTWYTDSVIWASGAGIVAGTGSGFEPDRDISRQELVAMLYRYAKFAGMDTTKTTNLTSFTDSGEVADWAKDAMSWAVANGLVSGRSATTLVPTGTATRAEVAAILQRLVALMVK